MPRKPPEKSAVCAESVGVQLKEHPLDDLERRRCSRLAALMGRDLDAGLDRHAFAESTDAFPIFPSNSVLSQRTEPIEPESAPSLREGGEKKVNRPARLAVGGCAVLFAATVVAGLIASKATTAASVARKDADEATAAKKAAEAVLDRMVDALEAFDPANFSPIGYRAINPDSPEGAARLALAEGLKRAFEEAQTTIPLAAGVEATALNTLANAYRISGVGKRPTVSAEQIERWFMRAGELRRQISTDLGEDEEYAAIEHNLAWFYHDQGRFREAIDRFREALDIRERIAERDRQDQGRMNEPTEFKIRHDPLLRSLSTKFHLAWALADEAAMSKTANWNTPIQYLRDVIAARQKRLGDGSRAVAIARVALAAVLISAERSPLEQVEALAQLAMASDAFVAQGGAQSPNMIYKRFLDAATLRRKARNTRDPDDLAKATLLHAESVETERRVLADLRRFVGDSHPLVAMVAGSIRELAGLLRAGDNPAARQRADALYEEALELIADALQIARLSPFAGHPKMIEAMSQYADALLGRNKPGDDETAADLIAEAWEYSRIRKGEADPQTTALYERAGRQLAALHRSDELDAAKKSPPDAARWWPR